MVATEVKIVCNQAPVTASRGNFRQLPHRKNTAFK
jgi:hypothetical protein